MPKLARVSQAEIALLISSSDRENPLPIRFGNNLAFLDLDEAKLPVLRRLAEIRGLVDPVKGAPDHG
jgi:hypothetical protein